MPTACVADVNVTDHELTVRLSDGREIGAPLSWFPRLQAASREARANWEPVAAGRGIHWPQIDEDVSIDDLLRSGQSA